MKLLLDTHILIWALTDDPRLPAKAKRLILDPDNTVSYSAVSIWEIAIKHALHPDHVEFTGETLAHFCQSAGFLAIEMKDKHVFSLETLARSPDAPPHHDPFDRMLIAQAKAEKATLLTHDALLQHYSEPCVLIV